MTDTFTPSPGRIVMVRYVRNGLVVDHPAIVVEVLSPLSLQVTAFTNDVEEPTRLMAVNQRKAEENHGWYRPGAWPQPTLGASA